jgi:hypothetical protein
VFVPRVTGGFEVRYWHLALGGEVHVSTLTSFQIQLTGLF